MLNIYIKSFFVISHILAEFPSLMSGETFDFIPIAIYQEQLPRTLTLNKYKCFELSMDLK